MDWSAAWFAGQFVVFALVLARTAGLVLTAPIYSSRSVPWQLRALLAVALALLVTPLQSRAAVPAVASWGGLALLLGAESIVGAVLGLGIAILFGALQLAGQLVGQLSGTGLAEVYDPEHDGAVPLMSQWLHLFGLAVFVVIGGHRLVVQGLLETFAAMPPGQAAVTDSLSQAIITLAGESFSLAIRVAAPAVVALLLSTLVLGLVGRTLPQLNVMSVGLGVNLLVMLVILGVSLGSVAWAFEGEVPPAINLLVEAVARR